MSLSGTLDTFALPDVLRLLAATRKTGRLDLESPGGRGALWLAAGAVAGAAAPARVATAVAEPPSIAVVFELLRCREGSFAFAAEAPCSVGEPACEVEDLLAGAEELLAEWREIEAVVPSVAAGLSLRAELPGPSATVTAEQWRMLVAVGGGTTVAALGADRSLDEMAVSRAVKGLVEAGLVEVGPVEAGPAEVAREEVGPVEVAPAPSADADRPAPFALTFDIGSTVTDDEWAAETRAAAADAAPPAPVEPVDDLAAVAEEDDAGPAPVTRSLGASLGELAASVPAPRPAPVAGPVEDDGTAVASADVVRHLAGLGPDAAAAVVAAVEATTPEERDAALEAIEVGDDGQPVNRSALLKFLSSVRS